MCRPNPGLETGESRAESRRLDRILSGDWTGPLKNSGDGLERILGDSAGPFRKPTPTTRIRSGPSNRFRFGIKSREKSLAWTRLHAKYIEMLARQIESQNTTAKNLALQDASRRAKQTIKVKRYV